jgi:hypothetical protein
MRVNKPFVQIWIGIDLLIFNCFFLRAISALWRDCLQRT